LWISRASGMAFKMQEPELKKGNALKAADAKS
jgi:hypothetical protein